MVIQAKNDVDRQYLQILSDIIDNGTLKHTRSGDVLSLYGTNMRFNLMEGIPLLTTKKVFVKGIIYELLWFLKGDTNIKYLVENGVNIWTDDALRFFKTYNIEKYNSFMINDNGLGYRTLSKEEYIQYVSQITKETFVRNVLNNTTVLFDRDGEHLLDLYKFGDLGDVYGKQWRKYGVSKRDQIADIINKLKKSPDDRRMVLCSWNPDVLDEVALPACHIFAVFNTKDLNVQERLEWLWLHSKNEYDEWKSPSHEILDKLDVPRKGLICSFTMRSNDFCCGNPYNIASYAFLTYLLAEICHMIPYELIFQGIDTHVYCNHIEAAKEQLKRVGYSTLPKLSFKRKITDINNVSYEDFVISDYKCCEPIKYELNVGL